MKKILNSIIVIALILTIPLSGSKKETFSKQKVDEGKARVNISVKVYNMKAKYSTLSVIILSGGSFNSLI